MKQRCYFHKHQFIQHFCALKQCTLPLCEQCLPIHQQQHEKKQEDPEIIPYQEAFDEAFQNMTSIITKNKALKDTYSIKLQKDRQQSIKLIEQYFKSFEKILIDESNIIQDLEQKLQKMTKGSIKTLIYYYSGDMTLRELNFPSIKSIASNLKLLLNDSNQKKEQIQTFRQIGNAFESIKLQQNSQTEEQKKLRSLKKKPIFTNDEYPSNSLHKNTNEPYVEAKKFDVIKNLYPRQNKVLKQNKTLLNLTDRTFDHKKQQSEIFKYQLNERSQSLKKSDQDYSQAKESKKFDYVILPSQQNEPRRFLDKYPSMNSLSGSLHFSHENRDMFKKNLAEDNIPKKWNRHNEEDELNASHQTRNKSKFLNFQMNEPQTNEILKIKPLRTDDLQTYVDNTGRYEFGQQLGGRAMSLHQLPSSKRAQGIDQNFKKHVLSPQQIRKMLQKRIQQRGKMLSQKKQYNLKIKGTKNEPTINQLQNIRKTYDFKDIKNGYSTKQSIINQIYRQTRY